MSNSQNNNPIVLFDGVCNLCNASINFLIKHDKEKKIRYALLQSDTAKSLLKKCGEELQDPESVIVIDGNKIYSKSNAALILLKYLPWYWRLLRFTKIIPVKFRDAVYDFIARNRYKWFGKKDKCMIPTPDIKELFLD